MKLNELFNVGQNTFDDCDRSDMAVILSESGEITLREGYTREWRAKKQDIVIPAGTDEVEALRKIFSFSDGIETHFYLGALIDNFDIYSKSFCRAFLNLTKQELDEVLVKAEKITGGNCDRDDWSEEVKVSIISLWKEAIESQLNKLSGGVRNEFLGKLDKSGYTAMMHKMTDQHFEGSVYRHTEKAIDAYIGEFGSNCIKEVCIALLLHDCGKDKVTQKVDEAKGTITYPGHAVRSHEIFRSFLDEKYADINTELISLLILHHDIIWQLKKTDSDAPDKSKLVKKIKEAISAISQALPNKNEEEALKLLYQISIFDEAGNVCSSEKNRKKNIVAIRFKKIFGLPVTEEEITKESQAE